MSRSRRDQENTPAAPPVERSAYMTGMMAGATLAGVAVVILLSYMNWQETRQAQKSLEDRIAQLDSRLTQLSGRVGGAAPAERGPDPAKVYTIKTEGAQFQGPRDAPVSIVEFSDFQ